MDVKELESYIVDIPDYPEPGVIFKDITPLFADPKPFRAMIDARLSLQRRGDYKGSRSGGARFYDWHPRCSRVGCWLYSRS